MVTLTQLRYVVAVFEEKHFGRAAIMCHVSQPSLSLQIQKVEDLLNIILFDRSKKPVMTTAKGEKFVIKAKKILSQIEDLETSLSGNQELSGVFKLGVIPTLGPYLIPLFLEAFSKKHPKVRLKIYEKTTKDIVSALREDSLDAGLLVTPLREDQIIERVLFSEKLYIYASKDHELNSLKCIKSKDLKDQSNFWLLNEGHCLRDQALNLCDLNTRDSNFQFETGSLETIKELVKRGTGFTILPEMAALGLKDKIKPFKTPEPARQVSLVHSRAFLKEDELDALEEVILKNLPKTVKNLKTTSLKIVPIK